MELRHLRYFVAVAEELHFGRAARRLHIAQPPLSQQIHKLEEELGVELFARTKRHVALTRAGKAFLVEARQALLRAERAAEMARRADRGEIGPLVVACGPLTVSTLLPDVLPAFRARYPEVDLRLIEVTWAEAIESVENGAADIGLLLCFFESETLATEIVTEIPFGAALPPGHRLSQRRQVRMDELAKEPFVLFPKGASPGYYRHIFGSFRQAGFTPEVVHEALHLSTLLALVAAGYGISLLPLAVGEMARERGVVLVPVQRPRPTAPICIAWRRADSSPVITAFIEVVRSCCRAAKRKSRP